MRVRGGPRRRMGGNDHKTASASTTSYTSPRTGSSARTWARVPSAIHNRSAHLPAGRRARAPAADPAAGDPTHGGRVGAEQRAPYRIVRFRAVVHRGHPHLQRAVTTLVLAPRRPGFRGSRSRSATLSPPRSRYAIVSFLRPTKTHLSLRSRLLLLMRLVHASPVAFHQCIRQRSAHLRR